MAGIEEEQRIAGELLERVADFRIGNGGAAGGQWHAAHIFDLGVIGHIVIIASWVRHPMTRQKHHADIALAYLTLKPGEPIKDRSAVGVLIDEKPHLHFPVEAAILFIQGGSKVARILRGPMQRRHVWILKSADAHDKGIKGH